MIRGLQTPRPPPQSRTHLYRPWRRNAYSIRGKLLQQYVIEMTQFVVPTIVCIAIVTLFIALHRRYAEAREALFAERRQSAAERRQSAEAREALSAERRQSADALSAATRQSAETVATLQAMNEHQAEENRKLAEENRKLAEENRQGLSNIKEDDVRMQDAVFVTEYLRLCKLYAVSPVVVHGPQVLGSNT